MNVNEMDTYLHVAPKTLEDVGFFQVKQALEKHCGTMLGQELARELRPFSSIEAAREKSLSIAEAKALQVKGEPLSFGGIYDLRNLLDRLDHAEILEPHEILVVAQTLRRGILLRRHILGSRESWAHLSKRVHPLIEHNELVALIERSINEQGELKDTASEALLGLRKKVQATQADVVKKAQQLLDQTSLASIWQDRYVTQREGRYVLPVRSESRVALRGMVQDQSASGATLFVEPDSLIEGNNQWKLSQLALSAEIHRILKDLSQQIAHLAAEIRSNLHILAELDLIQAGARLSVFLDAHPLHLLDVSTTSPQGGIFLRKARHPLLLQQGSHVVQNDIVLSSGQGMIVSGPNAGGKTVALKLTGLFLLMARSGLHCPCEEGSSMLAFEALLTDIGDEQSVERNVSTFSAHLQNLRFFLEVASPASLILLDEIAAGTDPEQGAALAQAMLVFLVQKGATVLVSTHYPSLKLMASNDDRFVNASVGYDLEHLQPTYVLHLGWPGPSETIPVAKKLGIPSEIIQYAQALIHSDRIGVEALLRDLTQQKQQLVELENQTKWLQKEAEEKEKLFDALVLEAHAEVQKQRKKAHDQAVISLKEAKQALDELKGTIRKKKSDSGSSMDEFSMMKKRIDQASSQVSALRPLAPLLGHEMSAEELVVGKEVYIHPLGAFGVLLSKEDRGKVWVQSGPVKLQVSVEEVRKKEAPGKTSSFSLAKKYPTPVKKKEEVPLSDMENRAPALLRTFSNTIDLRGQRVDAALAKVERFVDQALLAGEHAIFIIHGHGTGALKQAIRDQLAGYSGIQKIEMASQEEGGDGVTVAFLS